MALPGGSIGTCFVEIDLDPNRYLKSQQQLYKDAESTSLNIEANFKKLGIHSSAEMDLMANKVINAFNMIANSSKATADDVIRAEETKNAKLSELADENFRNLGIKSSAGMDIIRDKIINSYNEIANSSTSTANDILRAEEAKNAKLSELAEQQFGHQKTLIEALKESWIEASIIIYAIYRASMKIFDMAEGWVKLDIAQGVADRSLKAVMETTGRYSETFYQSTLKQAQAYERLTGMTDQAIEGAQKFLITIKALGNEYIPRATAVMMNLAAMMGGGEGGLQMAAASVNRALQGAVEGLKRQGIVIDVNTFKTRGAIGVFEELEKRVNGQAEALTQGSGQWKLLGNAIEKTKESMGAFLNELTTKNERLKWWIDSIYNLSEAIKLLTPSQLKIDILNDKLIAAYEKFKVLESDRSKWGGKLFTSEGELIIAEAKIKLIRREIDEELKRLTQLTILANEIIPFHGDEEIASLGEKTWDDYIRNLNLPSKEEYERRVKEEQKRIREAQKAANEFQRITEKIKELTLSEYEYKKYLIEKNFEDNKKHHANIEKATQLHNLELEKLDKEFLAKQAEWRKLYSEEAAGRPPLTSFLGEYIKDLESAEYAFKGLVQQSHDFNEKIKEFEGTKRFKEFNEELKKTKEASEKIREQWEQVGKSIGNSFTDAFSESIMGNQNAFRDLGKFIGKSMISQMVNQTITQQFIQPFINNIMAGMSNNLVAYGTPAGPGQTVAPAWMGSNPNVTSQYIGGGIMAGSAAYSMYQQRQAGTLTPMSGFMQGATAGAVVGSIVPGIGTAIGAIIGGFIGSFAAATQKDNIAKESVNILWEIIDGKVKEVSESWRNSPRSQLLIDEVQKSLQAQIDFTKQITIAAGGKLENYNIITGSADLTKTGVTGGSIESILSAYSRYAAIFGKQFVEDFTKEFSGSFSSKVVGFWKGNDPKEIFVYFNQYMADQLSKILGSATDPGKLAEYQKIANYFYEGQSFSSLVDTKGFDIWINTLKDRFLQIAGFFGNSLSSALLDTLKTGEYASFEQNLRNSLSETIKSAVIEGFLVQEIMPKVLQSFQEQQLSTPLTLPSGTQTSTIPALWDVISQYQSGETSLADALFYMGKMKDSFNTQMTGINDLILPLIEGLNFVGSTLGENTTAIQSNTDAIIGPVNSFLMSLDTGPLAPYQSMAKLMDTQSKLYTEAFANPQSFSEYASFMTSSWLPQMQATSPDYAGVVSGVRSDVMDIPWYKQANQSATANDIGTAVATAVKPMLLDIKEAANITVNVLIDGKEVKTVVVNSLDDPGVVKKIGQRIKDLMGVYK